MEIISRESMDGDKNNTGITVARSDEHIRRIKKKKKRRRARYTQGKCYTEIPLYQSRGGKSRVNFGNPELRVKILSGRENIRAVE